MGTSLLSKKPSLTSEGEPWRHQRRIIASAFHNKRIIELVALFIHRLANAVAVELDGCSRRAKTIIPAP